MFVFENILKLSPYGHRTTHINLVKGGQHGGILLGFQKAGCDSLTNWAHGCTADVFFNLPGGIVGYFVLRNGRHFFAG